MLFFSGASIPLMSDKKERLLLHIAFAAFFFNLAYVIYLFIFGTLKLVVF